MANNIFTELKTNYEFLTKVEKIIADLILSNPQKFITYSMAELSGILSVSQGSINNFSKKFSTSGFSSLKLKIAGNLSDYQEKPFAVIDKSHSIKAAMELKIKENIAAFQNAFELNDETVMKNATDKILSASKIEIYGVFQSAIVAKDFCYNLIQLGIPATFVDDTLMCAVSASMLDKKDLVIAISSTGQTKEVIDAVQIAKKNDVPIIVITSNRSSILAGISDDVLLAASSGMSISDRTDEIRMTQLLVLDTLCSYIRSKIDAEGKEHFYKLKDIINSHSIKD